MKAVEHFCGERLVDKGGKLGVDGDGVCDQPFDRKFGNRVEPDVHFEMVALHCKPGELRRRNAFGKAHAECERSIGVIEQGFVERGVLRAPPFDGIDEVAQLVGSAVPQEVALFVGEEVHAQTGADAPEHLPNGERAHVRGEGVL